MKSAMIGFPHRPPASGGPGTFQTHLEGELRRRGFDICYPEHSIRPDLICIVGGTRKLGWIWRCKQQGTKVVHRLDGINWRHRVVVTTFKEYVQAELRNQFLRFARSLLADHVVYQSNFIRAWWEHIYGPARCPCSIVHNGTDLDLFKPFSDGPGLGARTMICVEGNIAYDEATAHVVSALPKALLHRGVISACHLYGGIDPRLRARLEAMEGVKVFGRVSRADMPAVFRNAGLFLVLEVNPPCPNAVIEALASGLPVVGYRSGSLAELVPPEAGRVVDYGGDPWGLERPQLSNLESAVVDVMSDRERYSDDARRVAEQRYDVKQMASEYIAIFERLIGGAG